MNKYILLAAVAISLIACDTEDNYIDEPVAAQISATIGESPLSRARDITWESGDSIGISMSGRYINMKYVTENDDGTFAGTTMYFKNKQEPVTITAYYPYTGVEEQTPAAIEASTGADRQNSKEQPKFDFLFASLEGVTGANPNVNLQFSHRMSKLTLVLKKGNQGTDVSKITSYTLEGLAIDGTFNPVTGECGAKSDAETAPLTINLTEVVSEKALPSLLLFPQEVDKLTLKIKDREDQDYTCELKLADNRLAPGNNYLFNITVKKTGLTVVNPSITDWKGVDSEDHDAISDDSDD